MGASEAATMGIGAIESTTVGGANEGITGGTCRMGKATGPVTGTTNPSRDH